MSLIGFYSTQSTVTMSRAEAAGDQRIIAGKLAARYDTEVEAEVIGWFQDLLDEEVPSGMSAVMNHLKTGVALVKLAIKVREGTPNCPPKAAKMRLKPNTLNAPFKQMENIQVFLNFCEAYGVPKTGLFQTVDLYEGRNMAQFLNSVQQLGTEAQRQQFSGPTIGPKPVEKNDRGFTEEQLRASHGVIGLQSGTNKFASQKGMRCVGAARYCADIRADDIDKKSMEVLTLQGGTNLFASQKGMRIGAVRHVSDIRADDFDRAGADQIGLQAGSNKFANQKGMCMGNVRHCSERNKYEEQDQASSGVLTLQGGTNKFASQKGMSMGAVRHASDIRCDQYDQSSAGHVGLQMGTNECASQKGMQCIGALRHVSDMKIDQATMEGAGLISLQMGTNKLASQKGMKMGKQRHVYDQKVDQQDVKSGGVIGLQAGTNEYATQAGYKMGMHRKI